MKVKRKLDGGLKKILILFLFFIVFTKNISGSQILDYETEQFINSIIKDISVVNKINREIKFKINNSNEINAFVDINNIIHINSGLIQHCSDYIALLSVLAHEIGHINLNHISLRKKTIDNINKFNNLTFLSIIAGSAITQNPEFFQSSIFSTAALSNQYIEFSKEQEMEADLYAVNTLNLLNVKSDSVIKLLKTIEEKQLAKGFSKKNQRISTHPYFEDRILLVNNLNGNETNGFKYKYNEEFNFIKAKFIGYSDTRDLSNKLEEPYKSYANLIRDARNGNLKKSLVSINKIIKNNENNFLIETKGDILFSYGYTKEALKFYEKNLSLYPQNYYAKIRIFENINTKKLSESETELIFNKNKELLYRYYNNKNVLFQYIKLSQKLDKKEWIDFFNFFLSINEINENIFAKKMNKFKTTKDKDLLKLINIILNKIT